MRILYVAQRVPYPPDRGDKITTCNEVRHLARNHEVAVACLADDEADMANVEPLAKLVASVDAVPLRSGAAKARALAAVALGKPFTVGYFNERQLHKKVAARAAEKPFDLAIVYSSGVAQYAEALQGIPRIMQFADLDSLKWQQYADKASFPKSWLYAREYRLLLDYERHIARTFDHSLVCTRVELDDLQRLIPDVPASCVGNGVDLDYFQPTNAVKQAAALIFTGVMDYHPNVEGVVWFCNEVLPLIRCAVPEASFTICGARPNAQVLELGKIAGVRVTGRVPDVRPYLAEASVCVVPLRIARGIQNKLMEAMAMGLPTVTCTASFNGIEATPGRDIEVADTPEAFAAATIRLLQNPALRTSMGAAARHCMENEYRWEHQLAKLDEVIASVVNNHH